MCPRWRCRVVTTFRRYWLPKKHDEVSLVCTVAALLSRFGRYCLTYNLCCGGAIEIVSYLNVLKFQSMKFLLILKIFWNEFSHANLFVCSFFVFSDFMRSKTCVLSFEYIFSECKWNSLIYEIGTNCPFSDTCIGSWTLENLFLRGLR